MVGSLADGSLVSSDSNPARPSQAALSSMPLGLFPAQLGFRAVQRVFRQLSTLKVSLGDRVHIPLDGQEEAPACPTALVTFSL